MTGDGGAVVGAQRLDADLLRALYPHPVAVGLRREGDGRPLTLARGEAELLSARAVEKRRLQFALGRAAAHDALAELGLAVDAVGRGPGGEPLWPPGVVGSIAHTGQVGVAVVGSIRHYAGVGVDVEGRPVEMSAGAARFVCSAAELAWARAGRDGPELAASVRLLLVFSAKEAIFKAVYPVERVWLGFSDAELTWSDALGGFSARLRRDAGGPFAAGTLLTVRVRVLDAEVVAATWA